MTRSLAARKPTDEATSSQQLIAAIDRYYADLNQAVREGTPYLAVPIDLIRVDRIPDVALFLPSENGAPPKVFRPAGLYMSQIEIDTLASNGVTSLLIAIYDANPFTGYVEGVLTELPPSSHIADEKKVQLLRSNAISVMQDILNSPTPENIERGTKTVTGFVYVLMKDPRAYGMLLSLSSHDHYTLQHSVGVSTNAIILAHKLGIQDERALIEVGVGALIHDIGKTKVPTEIINKKGPLDEAEWAIMKQHSRFGYELIKDNPNVGMRAKLAVLQHHEEPAGTGYPLGLKSEQIDLYAKIVTLADIYNALTTDRSYSTAKPPFEAFKLIRDKLSHKIDHALFEQLVMIYGGTKPSS